MVAAKVKLLLSETFEAGAHLVHWPNLISVRSHFEISGRYSAAWDKGACLILSRDSVEHDTKPRSFEMCSLFNAVNPVCE